MIATYVGPFPLADGVMIADGTDPWVEVDGVAVDWMTHPLLKDSTPDLPRCNCPASTPGILPAMNTPEGIQRCDECQMFDGDLDAALALAKKVGGVVKFEIEEDE